MSELRELWRIVLSVKALLSLAVFWVLLGAEFNLERFNSAYARWPQQGSPTIASRFATWDVAHYLRLAEGGYEAGAHSCAFYPLWPAVIRVATALTGGRPVLASMLLANLLSLVAFWLFYRLVERHYGAAVGRDALILLLAFPGALFFAFPYTESLYLVLVLVFFLCLESGRYGWAAVTGFMLPLGRPVGVFILLPLVWHLYERYGIFGLRKPIAKSATRERKEHKETERSEKEESASGGAGRLLPWVLLAFPLLGYAAYFGLMYAWTGNAFEGFEAQKAYPNSPSIKNMFHVAGFTHALANLQTLDGMMDSVLDRAFFLLVLILLPFIYRLNKTWFFYTLPAGLVPALTSWFMSYRRYVMVLFPVFVVLALLLAKAKSRWLFWYYVALMALIQAWAVKQFITFNWAG